MPNFTTTYAEAMRADGKFPAALRLESISPKDARGIILHALRKIGELENIDFERSELNRILKGGNDIAERLVKTHEHFKAFNHRSNIAGLRRNRGPKEARDAQSNGPREPWSKQKKHRGPLREGILTVHRNWFEADESTPRGDVIEFLDDNGDLTKHDARKYAEFSEAGRAFLQETFGSMLCYARMDCDEQSGHIHFILYDHVKEPPSHRYLEGRYLMRTSHHECIGGDGKKRGYEIAQDRVAAFFARDEFQHMAIVRGEPRAEMKREAAKDVTQMLEEQELDVFLGADKQLPSGSTHAKAMHLLKRKIEEATKQKGAVHKIRKDERQGLKLDYFEIAGLLTTDERRQHPTRRARQMLLDRLEETHGSVDYVLRDPDRALRDLIQKAGATTEQRRRTVVQRQREVEVREQSVQAREATLVEKVQEFDKRSELLEKREKAFEGERSEFAEWSASLRVTLISAIVDAKKRAKKLSRYLSWIRKFVNNEKARAKLDEVKADADLPIDDGGFRVRKGATSKDTLARLDGLSNRQLNSRLKASETYSWAFEDAESRGDFSRGVIALKFEGEMRGLDFLAMTQDLSKAKDPERAKRHTDLLVEPPVLNTRVETVRVHMQ